MAVFYFNYTFPLVRERCISLQWPKWLSGLMLQFQWIIFVFHLLFIKKWKKISYYSYSTLYSLCFKFPYYNSYYYSYTLLQAYLEIHTTVNGLETCYYTWNPSNCPFIFHHWLLASTYEAQSFLISWTSHLFVTLRIITEVGSFSYCTFCYCDIANYVNFF